VGESEIFGWEEFAKIFGADVGAAVFDRKRVTCSIRHIGKCSNELVQGALPEDLDRLAQAEICFQANRTHERTIQHIARDARQSIAHS
jgi:hypothetical protein